MNVPAAVTNERRADVVRRLDELILLLDTRPFLGHRKLWRALKTVRDQPSIRRMSPDRFHRQTETLELLKSIAKPTPVTGEIVGIADDSVAVWFQQPNTIGSLFAVLVEVRADGSLHELA